MPSSSSIVRPIKAMLAFIVVDVDQFPSKTGRFADIFFEQPEFVSSERDITVKQLVGMVYHNFERGS
jgi:hypothetical protein